MSESGRPLLECHGLSKAYSDGQLTVRAIDDVSLELRAGEVTAVVGPSGSGKTTLLHLIGAVEHPDSGSVSVAGTELTSQSVSELAAFRARHVSFIFADLNLLPVLTIYENVTLGLVLLELSAPEIHRRTMESLEGVGLADQAHRLPGTLSSGERQRVAVARALARQSTLVIADEPTAHLDHRLAVETATLLRDMAAGNGAAVVLATHDAAVAELADRIVTLYDGRMAV